MEANLPTKTGPYWLKEDGGEKWIPVYVKDASHVPGWELSVLFPESEAELDLQDIKGQWAKAHKPDELATLRPKAKAYDEGKHEWGLFDTEGNFAVTCPNEQKYLTNGWTCRKVRVCNEVENLTTARSGQ